MSITPTTTPLPAQSAAVAAELRDRSTRGALLYAAQTGNGQSAVAVGSADARQTESSQLLDAVAQSHLGRNIDIKA